MKRFIMKVNSVENFNQEEYCIRLRGDRSTTLTIYTDKSEIPPRLEDTFSVTVLPAPEPTGVVAEQIAAVERCTSLADMEHAGESESHEVGRTD